MSYCVIIFYPIINNLENQVVNHRIRKGQKNNHVTNLEIVTALFYSTCANGEGVIVFNKTNTKLNPHKCISMSNALNYFNVGNEKFISIINTHKTLSFNNERDSIVSPTRLNLVVLGAYFGEGFMEKVRFSYLFRAFNQGIFIDYLYNGLGINSGTIFKLILPRDQIIV
jgi:hypothetical protein